MHNRTRTFAECDAILCAPGMPFEIETKVIDGTLQRVYKNLWASLQEFWLWASSQYGPKDYIVFEGQRFTYNDILDQSIKAATVFRTSCGVQKGDRIAICSRNVPQYLSAFWACQLIGAVPVVVNIGLPLQPLLHCILHAKSSIILADTDVANRIGPKAQDLRGGGVRHGFVFDSLVYHSRWNGFKLWADTIESVTVIRSIFLSEKVDISPEDNATIIFTSGTTGLPKGVLSTHRQFLTMLRSGTIGGQRAHLRSGLDLPRIVPSNEPQTGMLVAVPLFHVSGLTSFSMLATLSGMKIILMSKWNMNEAIRLIRTENVQSAGGVPSLISDLIDSDLKGHPFKFFLFGGAPAYPQLPKKAKGVFPTATLTHSFGMTESNAVCVAIAGEDYEQRPTSCGVPTPVNDMIVVRDDKVVTDGSSGEVWLRGPNIMKGYWGDPESTAKVLTKDGWYKTGDLGNIDSEGFLHIRDRIKDIIIRNGENIDSTSVENAIYLDERVYQVAAVGIPDERLGELVAAVVSIKERYRGQVNESELMTISRKSLPKSAWPYMVMIQDSPLELTASGKIVKAPLRALAREEWINRQKSKHIVLPSRL